MGLRGANMGLAVLAVAGVLVAGTLAAAAPAPATLHGELAFDDDVTVIFIPDSRAPGVTPQSASGCNQSVCIELTGKGLTVDRWRATARVGAATCARARFLRNGNVVRTSASVCSVGSGTLVAVWNSPGTFAAGDQLCNTWTGPAGKPCKTVKA